MSIPIPLGAFDPETRLVPISSIQNEPRATNGIVLDPGRVAAFSHLMREGVTFPPIKVWHDGDTCWLSRGLHPLSAAESAGITHLLCEVHAGTFSDAQWDSYGSNRTHASRLSLVGTRNLLAVALQHPIAATLSDAQIASHLGVATSFVRRWNKRLPPKAAGYMAPIEDISEEIVQKAVRYMRANLGSGLNIAKLARQIGVSAPHLRRRFRLAAQLGPKAVFDDLRMELAQELLGTTDLSVKEIAGQLGYERVSAFDRVFLRVWGASPSGHKTPRTKQAERGIGG
jgi:AraC-like DNA-binding protein